jgi:GGDEF domain-containing protein
VLTPEAFEFVLTNELKRAQRSQNYLTLVVVEPTTKAGVREVARLISRDIRETDLLSDSGNGQLSVVLLDADLDSSIRVVDRFMARLDHYQFAHPLAFGVGAACCPTHGADAESLRRAAASRPVRTQGHRSSAQRDSGGS